MLYLAVYVVWFVALCPELGMDWWPGCQIHGKNHETDNSLLQQLIFLLHWTGWGRSINMNEKNVPHVHVLQKNSHLLSLSLPFPVRFNCSTYCFTTLVSWHTMALQEAVRSRTSAGGAMTSCLSCGKEAISAASVQISQRQLLFWTPGTVGQPAGCSWFQPDRFVEQVLSNIISLTHSNVFEAHLPVCENSLSSYKPKEKLNVNYSSYTQLKQIRVFLCFSLLFTRYYHQVHL